MSSIYRPINTDSDAFRQKADDEWSEGIRHNYGPAAPAPPLCEIKRAALHVALAKIDKARYK